MTDCTYLIPSYNRPAYLRRLLTYLGAQNWDGPVIVADSSTPEHRDAIAAATRASSILSVSLVLVTSETPFYTKLLRALEEVRTPFVALCADDDFLNLDTLRRAASYLARHADFALACGRAVTVRVYPSHTSLELYLQRAVDEHDALSRVESLLGAFSSTLWSVYRTDVCLSAVRDTVAHVSQSATGGFAYRFPELFMSCRSVIEGKVAMLPLLLSVRQNPGTHDLYRDKIHGWRAIFAHAEFPARYRSFRDGLAAALIPRTDLPREETLQAIDAAFAYYRENIERPKQRTLLKRVRGVIETQWFKLLQEPHSIAEALRLELRAPLRGIRRQFSRDFRLLRPVIELITRYPHGIEAN